MSPAALGRRGYRMTRIWLKRLAFALGGASYVLRCCVIAVATLPLLAGCYYDQYFAIAWVEEVKLHDGRVMLVNLKFTYERANRSSKYDRTMLRDTELTFDAGAPRGRVTQVFKRVKPVMLDVVDGVWYVVLQGRGGSDSPSLTGQYWGPEQNFYGERIAKLGTPGFQAIPIGELPVQLKAKNLLYDHAPVEELAALDGKTLVLKFKAEYLTKYRRDPANEELRRPAPVSNVKPSN